MKYNLYPNLWTTVCTEKEKEKMMKKFMKFGENQTWSNLAWPVMILQDVGQRG